MDTKKLRQKILDLAIHGKLVPQDPNDEPASVLLERIRAEKERLIAEGKIKRSKKSDTSDTSHYENVPFEVPEGWCWCQFGEFLDVRDGTHDSPRYVTNGVPFVTSKNLKNGVIDFSTVSYISEEDHKNFVKRSKVEIGDILFAMIGSIGNPVKVKTSKEFSIKNVALFKPYVKTTNMDYVLLFLLFVQDNLQKEAKGGMQPFIPLTYFRKDLYIPLPPTKEQEHIVGEVEKLFAIVDELEGNQDSLVSAISLAKSKILDLAIHGKLVPQDPNDEPASELLKRINPKAAVSCDNPHYENVPFEIPLNWVWVKLGDITNYGKCSTCPVDDINNESWILELEDIEKDTGRVLVRHTKAERNIKGVRHSFSVGNVLFSKLRTYLNKVLLAKENGFCTTEIIPIESTDAICPQYLCYVLRSQYFLDYTAQCGYGVKMPRLSTNDARKAMIPLPPIPEQMKIIEKVETIIQGVDCIARALQ